METLVCTTRVHGQGRAVEGRHTHLPTDHYPHVKWILSSKFFGISGIHLILKKADAIDLVSAFGLEIGHEMRTFVPTFLVNYYSLNFNANRVPVPPIPQRIFRGRTVKIA